MPLRTRHLLYVALAGAVAACSGPPAAEPAPPASGEDELDALDLMNSWTTAADPPNPDVAGPLWWAPVMALRGPAPDMRALLAGRPREPVGVFTRSGSADTGAFRLTPGGYGVLVQYKENDQAAEGTTLGDVTMLEFDRGAVRAKHALGKLTVGAGNAFGAGGWRRAYLRFDVPAAAAGVRKIRITSATSGEWQFGLVALHREGRPFFAIAHNPDSVDRLRAAIAQGANALEPDLRASSDTQGLAAPADESLAVTEEGLTGRASLANGQSTLTTYLHELEASAARKLVIWDTKEGANPDYAAVGASLRRVAARERFDLGRSVVNVSSASMAKLWAPFGDAPSVGRAYDGVFAQVHSHTAEEWMNPVRAHRLTFQGLGVTPQLQVTEKWSVPISVYVRAREQEEFPKKIYFWTVNDPSAMRRMLDLGLDAMITDEIGRLRGILREQPYASMYRYAGDDDAHDAKHGRAWFHVESSSSLAE